MRLAVHVVGEDCTLAAGSRRCRGAGTRGSGCSWGVARYGCTGHLRQSVVVVETNGLQQIESAVTAEYAPKRASDATAIFASDTRADDEDDEEEEHGEVEDGVADDTTLAKLRLLERVDGWADLTATQVLAACSRLDKVREMNVPWTQPEKHHRVELVDVWDA